MAAPIVTFPGMTWRTGSAAAIFAAALACGPPGPAPIAWGSDECRHCHMTIVQPEFAAELVTARGKVLRFDDVGCLAAFVAGGEVPPGQVHSLWVSDFLAPDGLFSSTDAVFLLSDSARTPMSTGVVALRAGLPADSLRAAWQGRFIPWDSVVARARDGAQ
jgi:copper chaperone NosL